MAVSDATLVGRVLAGDAESFRPLVERYQDAVFGVALSVTGSAADAEDVAQETFVRAHQSLDTLRKPDSFGSWLCQIARSTSRRHLRGDARRRKRHAALAGSRGTAPGPDELAAHRELRGQVMDALCRLSQAIREAATLFYIDGYTTTDISRFTGRPVGTVKRRLHDARKQLRKELVAMLGDELKRSRPGKEFAAKVLATIERVRVWQGGPEGETTLMLIDSEGRAYTSPIGGYEAEVVQRSVAGEKSAQPPELHAALLQILAQFGRTIERVKLACAPAPNLKATVTLKADAGPRTVVDVIGSRRDVAQFGVQTGAPVELEDELADEWACRGPDGEPVPPETAWRKVPKGRRTMFPTIAVALEALERHPDSKLARRAIAEAEPGSRHETPLVKDTTDGQDTLLRWHAAHKGTPLQALADGLLGAYYVDPGSDCKEALPHLESAHRLAPEDERAAFDLATAYTAQGRRREALDLIEQYRFPDAVKCGNFAVLWKNPRFRRAVGKGEPNARTAFEVKGTCGRSFSARPGKGLAAEKGIVALRSLGVNRQRSITRELAQGELVGVARLHCTAGPEWDPLLIAETEAGHALGIPYPPFPDFRDQDLWVVLTGQVTPWRRRSEFVLGLLKGAGVKVEAAVLHDAEGGIVGTLAARADGRRELVCMDGISAVLLVAEARRPLLVTEALADRLSVRGKSGRPLTPKGARRKLSTG